MDDKKRLSIVIGHWIEHNRSHMDEYKKWAKKAEALELNFVMAEIEEAIEKLVQCNHCLEKALKGL